MFIFFKLQDTRQPVLEEAQKLGIKEVFLIDPKSPSRNTAIKIWEQIGDYPRVTFDCRGSKSTNETAIDVSYLKSNNFSSNLHTSLNTDNKNRRESSCYDQQRKWCPT